MYAQGDAQQWYTLDIREITSDSANTVHMLFIFTDFSADNASLPNSSIENPSDLWDVVEYVE
jgi:hypothetical protein